MDTNTFPAAPSFQPARLPEVFAALPILALGAVLLWIATAAPRAATGGEGWTSAPPRLVVEAAFSPPPPGSKLLLVVVPADSVAEVEDLLKSEARVRDAIGEEPRDVEVIGAGTDAEAEVLRDIVAGDNSVPGASYISPVIVRLD